MTTFESFLSKQRIVDNGIGIIIAMQVNNIVNSFAEVVLEPISNSILQKFDIDRKQGISILGTKFILGTLLSSILRFIITMYIVYRLWSIMPRRRKT